jgi:hypothetical protein
MAAHASCTKKFGFANPLRRPRCHKDETRGRQKISNAAMILFGYIAWFESGESETVSHLEKR